MKKIILLMVVFIFLMISACCFFIASPNYGTELLFGCLTMVIGARILEDVVE